MHCVERDEAIGIECSLTLFEAHQMLPDLYIKPSMKLAGQVSLFAVLVQWQVMEAVVEAVFYFSCL